MLTTEQIEDFYRHVESMGFRFPVAAISKATGLSKGNVSEYLNRKKEPSENFINAVYNRYPVSSEKVLPESVKKRNTVPFYDAPASAGFVETEMTAIHAPAGTIDVGDLLHDSQAAIRIYGNSMVPNYPAGCVVGLREAQTRNIIPGEVYVIETKDSRMLKRLFHEKDDPHSDHVYCYSDNIMKFEGGSRNGLPAYPPFLVHKTEVIRLFMVTGVIKRNMNSVIINRSV